MVERGSLTHRSCRILIYAASLILCLSSLLFLVPDTANAEEVYGTVQCSRCAQSILLVFKKGSSVIARVRADSRYYSVYLAPGPYDVDVISNGLLGTIRIRSFTSPQKQDLYVN